MQPNKGHRNRCWQGSEDEAPYRRFSPTPYSWTDKNCKKQSVDHVAGEYIRPETDSERQQASRRADELNRKQKDREEPTPDILRGTRKSLEVTERSVMPDSLPIEICKRNECAREGDGHVGGRRGQKRKHTE